MNFRLIPLFVFLFLGLFASQNLYAQKKPKKDKKKEQESPITQSGVEQQTKIERLLIEASYAKFQEDFEEAANKYEEILIISPKNDAAKYELANIYFNEGRAEDAISLIKEAIAIDNSNKWYKTTLAEIYAASGKFKAAAEVFEDIVEEYPKDYDFYFDWTYMLMQAKEYEEAINAFSQLEKQIGINENISLQKQKLYLKLNKLEPAANEIEMLIEAFPTEIKYYSMLADLYEGNGAKDKALAVYERMVEIDRTNPRVLLALADLSLEKGEKEKSFNYLKQAVGSPELDIDTKVKIIFPYLQFYEQRSEEIEDAFELIALTEKNHPEEAKIFALKGDLLYLEDREQEAIESYKKALQLQDNVFTVWQQLMSIYSEQENWIELERIAGDAREVFPNQAVVYLYKGIAEQEQKDYEGAIKSYDRGAKMALSNPRLAAQFYSNKGDLHHRLREHEESDKAYDKSLKLDPQNAYVLNNYSYYLSLRKENLEKAKNMSKLSNELEPKNAAFQDTYAWILFQLGEYKTAKEWQEKAIATDGNASATLLEHYGDILFKLGEKTEALKQWELAAKKENSEILQKKIDNGIWYE